MTLTPAEAVSIVLAALSTGVERPPLMPHDSEDMLDGYVLGYEQAARLVATHLGVSLQAAGLIPSPSQGKTA